MNFEPAKKLPHGRLTRARQQSILKCCDRSSISIFDAPISRVRGKFTVILRRRVRKRRACGEGSSESKNVTATKGVKEFSEECLEVTGAGKYKLFLQSLSRGTKPKEELNCL